MAQRWTKNAMREAVQMAREGLLEILDGEGRPIDPLTIEEAPINATLALTAKGREYLVRSKLGEEPGRKS
jgi:hypothetical protein